MKAPDFFNPHFESLPKDELSEYIVSTIGYIIDPENWTCTTEKEPPSASGIYAIMGLSEEMESKGFGYYPLYIGSSSRLCKRLNNHPQLQYAKTLIGKGLVDIKVRYDVTPSFIMLEKLAIEIWTPPLNKQYNPNRL